MFERFTEKSIKVMTLAQEEARRLGHNYVGTEQILLGLIGENTGIAAKVLRSMGVLLKDARQEVEKIVGRGSGFVAMDVPFTPRARRLLELAWDEARQLGHNYIGTEHLLLGLIRENDGVAPRVLEALGVELTKVRMHVIRMLSESGAASSSGTTSYSSGRTKTPTLDEFGRNLTMAAQEGRIDPLIGREAEIDRVIQILGRRTKNNPVLIGEPGVGKTAIAEGLAARIASCDVPEILRDKKVVQLDIGLLVAGTKFRGEFEERLKKLMQEVRSAGNVMLVIDELHTLIGAGGAEGAIDAANILKPALNRGDLQCIGATTLDEYRKRIERDAALARRFQPVIIDPPTVDQTIEIVKGLRQRYEEHHRLQISDEAIEEAAKLSDRYLNDRHLPDKAIDLIDEAASRVRLRASSLPPAAKEVEHELRKTRRDKEGAIRNSEFDKAASLREQETALSNKLQEMKAQNRLHTENTKPLVTAEDVAYVISSMTGIPLVSLTESETARLLSLEDDLHKQVIGQHEAVTKVAKAIRRSRVGLKNPNRPIGSFIFAGPTGVGKTELAKAVAQLMFKDKDAIIRIDMSEYMEHHTTSKLIGSPPGYVGYNDGGQLTEAVRRKPYSVVLFDEIEKAHPDVFNVMLQILDDGRLSDSKGRVVDFKNTIIIMTSNVGAQFIVGGGTKTIGIGAHSIVKQGEDADKAEYAEQQKNIKKLVTDTMKKTFRPEFLNRIDDIVIFQTLRKEEIRDIVDLMAAELNQRIKDQGMFLLISNSAKDLLAKEGYHRDYGARPLKRVIQRRIEDALAEQVLNGTLKEGDFIHAIADGEVIRFETITDKNQAEQLRSQTGFAK